jgi:hypothetical protein
VGVGHKHWLRGPDVLAPSGLASLTMVAPADRISTKEAAEILGRTEKAVQQLIHRKRKGGVGLQSERDESTGRRWTTRAWIENYLREGRVPRRPEPAPRVEIGEAAGRRPTTGEPTSVPEIIEELERLLARLRAVLVGR